MENILKAIETRSLVRITDKSGHAKGLVGIAMGYHALYDNVKVGFIDADGRYTGEFTTVSAKAVEVLVTPEDVPAVSISTIAPEDIRPGDTVEALNTSNISPKTFRVTVDRTPWAVNDRTTALSDGKSMFDARTDSLRLISRPIMAETTMIAVPFPATDGPGWGIACPVCWKGEPSDVYRESAEAYAKAVRACHEPGPLPEPVCGSTFTPPGFTAPLPCILGPHALDVRCESRSTGGLNRPWVWNEHAPTSTPRARWTAKASRLTAGDVITHRGRDYTVQSVTASPWGILQPWTRVEAVDIIAAEGQLFCESTHDFPVCRPV
ncbi:hypothetical protein [Streptomyces sp. CB03911]|uniref:hypothetical protein n=1 Tax=Streptomyces sp. CB03911 TaxID=1804758 RepID=UPI00093BB4A1|nr:hypothetical protein [Streptomyces sp. CB03911]OKI19263.1 hypothetical protein A6A07_07115 [Streptomyces sp. CB03911]